MTRLSVNINKIATLRNARGGNEPNLLHFAKIVLKTKACGITIHPRPDERHIKKKDVFLLKELLKDFKDKEFNIEGYPSKEFLDLILEIKPHQATLVPDPPHVLTSNAGWDFKKEKELLKKSLFLLKKKKIRVSLFLDPRDMKKEQWEALRDIKPDRVEFYTEEFVEKIGTNKEKEMISLYKDCLKKLQDLKVDINAGHDLNKESLKILLNTVPEIREVSIGQALISESLELGLETVINQYLSVISHCSSMQRPSRQKF